MNSCLGNQADFGATTEDSSVVQTIPRDYAAMLIGPNSELFDSKLRTTNIINNLNQAFEVGFSLR